VYEPPGISNFPNRSLLLKTSGFSMTPTNPFTHILTNCLMPALLLLLPPTMVQAATGSLQVTISPASAIAAGAQWQVDGGPLQASGAIVSGLSVGNHTVAFKPVTGFITAVDQTVFVGDGSTTITDGVYDPTTGSLQVTISPASLTNAQWQVDGGPPQPSGAIVSGLSVGFHTVSFGSVSNWIAPANQAVSITGGNTTLAVGFYQPATGSLQVTITPAAAIAAGAQWQVDSNEFLPSGGIISGLMPGFHRVSFTLLGDWIAPADQMVSVTAGNTTIALGVYQPATGSIQVFITPDSLTNAQWLVDDREVLPQPSGAIISGLTPGFHPISFTPISGWTTPANQYLSVTAGNTTIAVGVYVQQLLRIWLTGANVALAWPTNYPNLKLRSNTNLVGTNWPAMTLPAPVVVNGQNQVYLPPNGLAQFFRLGK